MPPAFGSLRLEPGFGGTVEENDGECEPEPAEARREGHEVKEVKEVRYVKEVEETNGTANVELRELWRLRSTEKRRRAAALLSALGWSFIFR